MSNLDLYKVKINNENININKIKQVCSNFKNSNTILLDHDNEKKDIMIIENEKIIYNLCYVFLKNKNLDIDNYIVEYWFKTRYNSHNLHCDVNEEIKDKELIYPEFSSIFYLNDHNNPTVITELNHNDSIYNTGYEKENINFIFPNELSYLVFNGKYLHGSLNKNDTRDRNIIAINIWNRNQNYPYKSLSLNQNKTSFNNYLNNITIENITNKNLFYYYNFYNIIDKFILYNELLYNIESSDYIISLLNNINSIRNNKIIIKTSRNNEKDRICNQNNENNVIYSKIENIKKNKITNDIKILLECDDLSKYTLFTKLFMRYNKKNYLYSSLCNYVLKCVNDYCYHNEWETSRHSRYPTTDIPYQDIEIIKPLIETIIEDVKEKIIDFYQLQDNNIKFSDKVDVFFVKYEYNENNDTQTSLEMHTDGSLFSFQILLNKNTDFDGGGTLFDDTYIHYPDIGDLCVHCGKFKHGGIPITKGKRYLLVGFLNIDL